MNKLDGIVKNKVLITGGAGFIGSHVVDKLIEQNHDVVVVDNFSAFDSGYRNEKAEYVNADILKDELEDVFAQHLPDYCIHLAAQASVSVAVQDPCFDAEQNIVGSIKVIENCKKYNVKKIIVASSAAVYGNPVYLPVDEKHSTNVLSQYGLSKLTMEKYLQLSGLDYIIFRFANVYGERQSAFGEAGVVAKFNEAIMNNEQVYIDSNGEQQRDFVYVKDVARACCTILNSDVSGEIINVSTCLGVSVNQLFGIMSEKKGYNLEPVHRPKRSGDIEISILDNTKFLNIMKDFEFTNIEVGLKNLIQYNVQLKRSENA